MSQHTIYFVRHGQTDWNAARRMQGQIDIPLNDIGRGQAKRNGEALREALGAMAARLHYVASPLSRASETMSLVRDSLALPTGTFPRDDRLKEMAYGQWEGMMWPRHAERTPEITRWLEDPWLRATPGGESYAMLWARVVAWLQDIPGDTVVVAHGGVMRVLRGHWLGLPPVETVKLDVPQDKVLVLRDGKEAWL
jgi:broad specificity phosphatase PhoE